MSREPVLTKGPAPGSSLHERVRLRSPEGAVISASRKVWGRLAVHGYERVTEAEAPPRMRVVAVVHKYPPVHNAGAELMLHSILRRLVAAGDRAIVVVAWGQSGAWELDGVQVISPGHSSRLGVFLSRADVVLTHLDLTPRVMMEARSARRPLVHLVHNDKQLEFHKVTPRDAALVVYNSRWLAEESSFRARSVVCRPPVFGDDYRTTPGESVTLVNLTSAKGAQTWYAAARELPDRPFLGVAGAYGSQITRNDKSKNVRIIDNTPAMRDVYAETRVLLMPSSYESFGRVAIEAGFSGIPTVAHPTPGLLESIGRSGRFVDREDVAGYVNAIRDLEDAGYYAEMGARARRRSEELEQDSDRELGELEAALLEVAGR